MPATKIDHDALFKAVLKTFFLEFLQVFFPKLAADIDLNSIQEKEQEILSDYDGGTTKRVDFIRQVTIKSKPTQIVVLIEPQSTNKADFARRICQYTLLLHFKYDLKVIPIAVLSYTTPQSPAPQTYVMETEYTRSRTLDFQYDTIQLNQLDWEKYVKMKNAVAVAFSAKMRMKKKERPRAKVAVIEQLLELGLDDARLQLMTVFADTYLKLSEAEEAEFRAEIEKLEPKKKEKVMEYTTSWMEKGLVQGRQEGRQEGLVQGLERGLEQGLEKGLEQGLEKGLEQGLKEGEVKVVLKLIARRFGKIGSELEAQITSLPSEKLEQLAEDLLDFKSADELVTWLEHHEK